MGNGSLLERIGMKRVREMDWWDSAELPNGISLTAVPAQHFSSRGIHDRDATLWTGFVLEGSCGSIYFVGDTGFGPHIEEIAERFDDIRLALLPIGAFLPRWFMSPVHMAPEDAVRAHEVLSPRMSIPIHQGTFALGDDGATEAVDLLRQLVASRGGEGFCFPRFGEIVNVPELKARGTLRVVED
jgi:L-ascorbate metabolism protein UlaG (beta-lactamase superfamily)